MGDWIKNNKFEAGLLLLVIVVVAAAWFLAGKWGQKYEEQQAEYSSSASTLTKFQKLEPSPPNRDTANDFKDSIESYLDQVQELKTKMDAFQPAGELAKPTPAQFITSLNEAVDKLALLFDQQGITYPEEQFRVGFERYTNATPLEGATPYLNFELGGLTWLNEIFANNAPRGELINLYRHELPQERGVVEEAPRPTRGGRKPAAPPKPPYLALPVELTIKTSERRARAFLAELVNSKDYFFTIRSIRILNEKSGVPPQPPSDIVQPAFDEPAVEEGEDPFEGFDFGDEGEDEGGAEPELDFNDPAPDAADRILGQVLGAEELFIFLDLELLLFNRDEVLPEVK